MCVMSALLGSSELNPGSANTVCDPGASTRARSSSASSSASSAAVAPGEIAALLLLLWLELGLSFDCTGVDPCADATFATTCRNARLST